MSDDFNPAGGDTATPAVGTETRPKLVPMKVGDATVYVEAVGDGAVVEAGDEFHAVGVDPQQAFETASEALKECVRVVGERVVAMKDAMRPEEVGIEFTITFDVQGKATIIPVLLTGSAKTQLGVKVTAKWELGTPRP